MKFILWTSVLACASCSSQDIPESKVPSVVINSVQARVPDVDKLEWEKQEGRYEAEYDINDSTEKSILVDGTGKILMTKQNVPRAALPVQVTEAIGRDYKMYRMNEVEKLEVNGNIYYQLELSEKGLKDLQLVFTADGKKEETIPFWD